MKATVIPGAHNALSGSRPLKMWMWLTVPVARCQRKDVEELLSAGVRCFDIRVRYDEAHHCWRGCHGLLTTQADAVSAIERIHAEACARPGERFYVRLIHEARKADYTADTRFKRLCKSIEAQTGGMVTLFGGRRKGGWELLYDFGPEPPMEQHVGSMAPDARWWERIFPFAYARRHKCTCETDGVIILRDFV